MAQRDPQREQFWRTTLDDWKQSGQSISDYCRSRRLTMSNFFRWRRIFAEGLHTSPAPAFVPLRVVAEPMVEVVLPTGLVVRLPLSADPHAITQLIAAVRAVSC